MDTTRKLKLAETRSPEQAQAVPDELGPEVELVLTETGEEVVKTAGEILYSDKKGLKPYNIVAPSKEKLAEWKREIDRLIAAIKLQEIPRLLTLMMNDGRRKGDHVALAQLLSEETMDETDIVLLAIGLFALREKSPWQPVMTRLKLLKGGDFPMESFFTKGGMANCYDINVFVKTMAAQYGITGEVDGEWIKHSKFSTPDGKVSDVLYAWKRGGLFQNVEKYRVFDKQRKHGKNSK